MTTHKPRAGGFFLFAAIIGGLIWGALNGQAMRGVLIGAVAGAILATLLWLIDRRR